MQKLSSFKVIFKIMSSMKIKRSIVTIETKLETIDQLAKSVRVSFLAVLYNIGIGFQLSEKIDYSNHLWSLLVRMIGVLL